jgi:hypothetical protein
MQSKDGPSYLIESRVSHKGRWHATRGSPSRAPEYRMSWFNDLRITNKLRVSFPVVIVLAITPGVFSTAQHGN